MIRIGRLCLERLASHNGLGACRPTSTKVDVKETLQHLVRQQRETKLRGAAEDSSRTTLPEGGKTFFRDYLPCGIFFGARTELVLRSTHTTPKTYR